MITTNTKTKPQLKDFIIYAIFAAITAVCSQITLPLPFTPIMISLGTLGIMLTSVLCSVKYKYGGLISVLIYLGLGAIGIPVFQGFKGGLAVLMGPTGGYIVGYLLMAIVIGFMYSDKKFLNILVLVLADVVLYVCGTAWFMLSTGNGLWQSLTLCVFPFLIGDLAKLIVAYISVNRIKPLIK
jgi:Uncharacterized conserved protein